MLVRRRATPVLLDRIRERVRAIDRGPQIELVSHHDRGQHGVEQLNVLDLQPNDLVVARDPIAVDPRAADAREKVLRRNR